MAIVTERISKNLLTLRKQLGLTQREFAEKLGTKQTTYAHWEKGGSVPDKDMWDVICSVTGKDVAWFYLDNSEPVEIVKGPEVAAFRAFEKMLSVMGKNGQVSDSRIVTEGTRKRASIISFLRARSYSFG